MLPLTLVSGNVAMVTHSATLKLSPGAYTSWLEHGIGVPQSPLAGFIYRLLFRGLLAQLFY